MPSITVKKYTGTYLLKAKATGRSATSEYEQRDYSLFGANREAAAYFFGSRIF
jgi:hypothetical protein